jgi:hypothetical protein
VAYLRRRRPLEASRATYRTTAVRRRPPVPVMITTGFGVSGTRAVFGVTELIPIRIGVRHVAPEFTGVFFWAEAC